MATFRSILPLIAVLFVLCSASAQRDLDFTVTTLKFTTIKTQKEVKWEFEKDTVEMPALRRIEKTGRTLRFTDLLNPSNQSTVELSYLGTKEKNPTVLVYQSASGNDMVIEIEPLVPRVFVRSASRTETFE